MCKQYSLVRQIIKEHAVRKKFLRKSRLKGGNCVKRTLKNSRTENLMEGSCVKDRDRWQDSYLTVWS